jgi:hypothetical protein
MYEAYGGQAVFLVVYIREAHPAFAEQNAEDAGWKMLESSGGEKVVYHQPRSFADRRKLAETACTFWEMKIPTLVDTMDEGAGDMYQGWPTRIYLLDPGGRIVYRGPLGPNGSNARAAEVALRQHLGLPQGEYVSEERRRAPSGRGRGQPSESRGQQRP